MLRLHCTSLETVWKTNREAQELKPHCSHFEDRLWLRLKLPSNKGTEFQRSAAERHPFRNRNLNFIVSCRKLFRNHRVHKLPLLENFVEEEANPNPLGRRGRLSSKKSSATLWWMQGFCILHMMGVDCYPRIYLYNDYIWKYFLMYTYCHLYLYLWNCTCIAKIYKQRIFVYRGFLKYVANARDFLIFNERCTSWEYHRWIIWRCLTQFNSKSK
jgi:hypothetical protein